MREYQICSHCIMDTSDEEIYFDDNGVCKHCNRFEAILKNRWFQNEEGRKRLDSIVSQIKEDGEGKDYDSVMGLSGGVDSSYVAYQAKKLGLRPLAIHVDCGWDSELAVKNIENIVKKLGFDLYTHVVDWAEMRDLQASFFKASVVNLDIPQDHAIATTIYRMAAKTRVKYILSGSNIATESILPQSWGYSNDDSCHIKGIHKIFGSVRLKTFPLLGYFKKYIYYRYVKGIKIIKILDLMPYVKQDAISELKENAEWRSYGDKHCESVFTRFFQSYYLPVKFGYDKRRAHLSSLIVSGQITRDEALAEMKKEIYSPERLEEEKIYFGKKLGFSKDEFEKIFNLPKKSHLYYPNRQLLQRIRAYKIGST